MTATRIGDAHFAFGDNWQRFASDIDERTIDMAVESLGRLFEVETLAGKSFLDIGSGSGLHSLAAHRLQATVTSFDYDQQSVGCTKAVRERYAAAEPAWRVSSGSALDEAFMESLGRFDVVYAWGVLHHTGDMMRAFELIRHTVADNGMLALAIYNDQGWASNVWRIIKRTYVTGPRFLRGPLVALCALRLWGPTTIRDIVRLQPFHTWRSYKQERGMNPTTDLIDWVGGYPFEVARPNSVTAYFEAGGFTLRNLKTCDDGLGCNEFVFRRVRNHLG